MPEKDGDKSFWGSLPGILTGAATLTGAIVAAFAHFYNPNASSNDNTVQKSDTNGIYQSYFADVDKDVPYLSVDGVADIKINGSKIAGTTTANDLRVAGKLSKSTWDFTGYVNDNYMYFAYDTGEAILKYYYKDYIGYWLGQNYDGSMLKCPYVFSKERLTKHEAIQKWPILGKKCEVIHIVGK